jgi:hypothetical protein
MATGQMFGFPGRAVWAHGLMIRWASVFYDFVSWGSALCMGVGPTEWFQLIALYHESWERDGNDSDQEQSKVLLSVERWRSIFGIEQNGHPHRDVSTEQLTRTLSYRTPIWFRRLPGPDGNVLPSEPPVLTTDGHIWVTG